MNLSHRLPTAPPRATSVDAMRCDSSSQRHDANRFNMALPARETACGGLQLIYVHLDRVRGLAQQVERGGVHERS